MELNDKRLPERFWARVEAAENGCWLWTGAKNGKFKYGSYQLNNDKCQAAHIAAFVALVGPYPEGLELDHLCRTPACVNPEHLEPVTHAENLRRGQHWCSKKTHCKHGHPFDAGNTAIDTKGKRVCRTCRREGNRKRKRHAREKKRQTQIEASISGVSV